MLKTGFKMSLMMIGADINPSPLDSQSTLTLSHDEVDNTHIKNCFTMIVAATGGVLKGVLRNSAKFTGKHLCQSLFLMKL